MQDLAGKVAVVTGAGSGIGEGIARAAARAGMQVVVADIDIEKARAVAADIGAQAMACTVDVSSLASVEAMRDATLEKFGGVHLLCNNAGVWIGALMHDAGVLVSFNSDSDELARRLNTEAAKAVKYGGLSETEAFKFVTINAAKQLAIDERVGRDQARGVIE